MLPEERAQPVARGKSAWPARILGGFRRSPFWLKIIMVAVAVPFAPFALLVYAVLSVAQGRRTANQHLSLRGDRHHLPAMGTDDHGIGVQQGRHLADRRAARRGPRPDRRAARVD